MAGQFIARKGLISLGDTQISGSLNITQDIITQGTVQASFDASTGTAISGAFDSVSSSLATRVASQEAFSSSLDATFATDGQVATAVAGLNAASSSYLLNTTDTFTGTLTVDGTGSFDKVGIGNTSPLVKLHIGSSLNTLPVSSSVILPGDTYLRFSGGGDGNNDYGSYIAGTQIGGVRILQLGTRNLSSDEPAITLRQGAVGIGTPSPDAKLAIANANGSLYRFGYGGTSDVYIDTNNMYFRTATGASNTVTINSSGFVGINETNPISQLHLSRQTTWGTSENRVININNTGTGGDINVAHNMGAITWYSGNSTPTAGIQAWRNTPASGNNIELRFDTAAAGIPYERMRIDSNGRVYINYSNSAIQTYGSNAFGATAVIKANTTTPNTALALLNGNVGGDNPVWINFINEFVTNQYNYIARIGAEPTQVWTGTASTRDSNLTFYTTQDGVTSEKARILSSGGITFNGDTASANALDDYEEGTWSPTIGGSVVYGSYGLNVVSASYTKIGRLVTLTGFISITGVNSAGSGYTTIRGLPFAKRTGTFFAGACETRGYDISDDVLQVTVMFVSTGSTDILYISGLRDNSTSVDTAISGLSAGDTLLFTITYEV